MHLFSNKITTQMIFFKIFSLIETKSDSNLEHTPYREWHYGSYLWNLGRILRKIEKYNLSEICFDSFSTTFSSH